MNLGGTFDRFQKSVQKPVQDSFVFSFSKLFADDLN